MYVYKYVDPLLLHYPMRQASSSFFFFLFFFFERKLEKLTTRVVKKKKKKTVAKSQKHNKKWIPAFHIAYFQNKKKRKEKKMHFAYCFAKCVINKFS